MTPERKAYLAKCSKREKFLRRKIVEAKDVLRIYKFVLNREPKLYPLTQGQIQYDLKVIRETKIAISIYRHELNRLKGMDRGGVPEFYHSTDVYHCPKCTTAIWFASDKYCPNCGRRILWEKVK